MASEFNERNADLSPDERWMAYQSNESGRYEVYVRPFPDVEDDLWLISTGGGVKPVWSRDGRELFYLQTGSPMHLMRVAVRNGLQFGFEAPEELLEWPYDWGNDGRTYDVSPDGQRFLVVKPLESSQDAQINIVLNWFEELRARVPVP